MIWYCPPGTMANSSRHAGKRAYWEGWYTQINGRLHWWTKNRTHLWSEESSAWFDTVPDEFIPVQKLGDKIALDYLMDKGL